MAAATSAALPTSVWIRMYAWTTIESLPRAFSGLCRRPTYRGGARDGHPAVWWDGHMPIAPDATLADVGEFGLISELVALFPQGEQVIVGPGDDAAVLRVKSGHVVVSTDLIVEGRH